VAPAALAQGFGMTALLTYADASVGYDAPVVTGASLEVHAGEIVGLIGPNGAGKTTLVRAVTRGARTFAGGISVDGADVHSMRWRDLARVVAVLPQAESTAFAFSGRQFVEMGRHAHVSRFGDLGPADHAAVDRAMELTDTVMLADKAVDTLSGGDLQRLTLAQTLAQEPRVLLLDEPTSHLDLNHRLQVLDAVRSLVDDGLAVLAVFHDLDVAARYSDRLAVVAGGRLRDADAPAEVLTAVTLDEVFGVRSVIRTDPVTGSVQVVPVVRSGATAGATGPRVLVVSGSGTGAAIMRRLALQGYRVGAGALPAGDTDHDVAVALGVPFTPLGAFTAMSAADEDAALAGCRDADAVVVVATPFGPANLGNLRAAAAARRPTVLVGRLDILQDFSRGEALSMWNELRGRGAIECLDASQTARCIQEAISR
jgi:iron complex transport system ATP-binding protein